MNGEPLPLEHGFPVRMLTPGLYGYVGACKWLRELELTTFAAVDAYWVQRGWAPQGPVKTASRIDTPAPVRAARRRAGDRRRRRLGAAPRASRAVEVRVDDGPWQQATLLPVPSVDTWVQWRYAWDATPGVAHAARPGDRRHGRGAARGARRPRSRTAPPAGTRSPSRSADPRRRLPGRRRAPRAAAGHTPQGPGTPCALRPDLLRYARARGLSSLTRQFTARTSTPPAAH